MEAKPFYSSYGHYTVEACISTAVILCLIAITTVCLRFWVRLRMTKTFIGIDDWLILMALIFVLGHGADQIVGAKLGLLGHDNMYGKEPPKDKKAVQASVDNAVLIFEKWTYGLTKLSVLFFFRRIFHRQKTFRLANNIMIGVVLVWTLVYFIGEFLVCGSNSRPGAHPCTQREWWLLWFGITDVLLDISILSLPYPCIRKLHLDRRDKFGLAGVFLLGFIATIFAIVRLAFVSITFERWVNPAKKAGRPEIRTQPFFWTTVEVCVSVIAACLPPLGPLLKKAPGPRRLYGSISHFSHRLGSNGTHNSDRTPLWAKFSVSSRSNETNATNATQVTVTHDLEKQDLQVPVWPEVAAAGNGGGYGAGVGQGLETGVGGGMGTMGVQEPVVEGATETRDHDPLWEMHEKPLPVPPAAKRVKQGFQ